MKPNHANIPLVMQRSKVLREQFAALRTKEVMDQSRYLENKGKALSVERTLSDGTRVTAWFFYQNKRKVPLSFRRKGSPLTPFQQCVDAMPIPPLFRPSGFRFSPLSTYESKEKFVEKEWFLLQSPIAEEQGQVLVVTTLLVPTGIKLPKSESIGFGVPRKIKPRVAKDAISDKNKRTKEKTLFEGSYSLILELLAVLNRRLSIVNAKLAKAIERNEYESVAILDLNRRSLERQALRAMPAMNFDSWLKMDTDILAELEGIGRIHLANRLKREPKEETVKIIGTVKPSSKKSNARRKANRKAAIKRASQK